MDVVWLTNEPRLSSRIAEAGRSTCTAHSLGVDLRSGGFDDPGVAGQFWMESRKPEIRRRSSFVHPIRGSGLINPVFL